MPRILALTCCHGRKETLDIFLHHMDYDLVMIDTIFNTDILRLSNNSLGYFEYSNENLGAKWNYGLDKCREFVFDYLLITGSDDIFSKCGS